MEKSVLASQRRDEWIWATVAAVVAAGPFIAGIAAGRTFVWRDTARLFAPARHLVVDALRAGRLPLWNPYDGLGAPFLAQRMSSQQLATLSSEQPDMGLRAQHHVQAFDRSLADG